MAGRLVEPIGLKELVENANVDDSTYVYMSVEELKAYCLEERIKELETMQQIDFSEDEPGELKSLTLEEYLEQRIAELKGKVDEH
jgi:hypothetical protein